MLMLFNVLKKLKIEQTIFRLATSWFDILYRCYGIGMWAIEHVLDTVWY